MEREAQLRNGAIEENLEKQISLGIVFEELSGRAKGCGRR